MLIDQKQIRTWSAGMDGGTGKTSGWSETAFKAVLGELQHASERLKELAVKRELNALRSFCGKTLQSFEAVCSRYALVDVDFEAKHRGMILREENLALKEEVFSLKKKMWEDERDRCQASLKIARRDFGANTEEQATDNDKLKSLLDDVMMSVKKKASYIEGYFEKIDSDLRELKAKDFSSSMFLLVLEKVRIYKTRCSEKFQRITNKLTGSKARRVARECLSEEDSDEETPPRLLQFKKNVFDRQEGRESKFESVGDHLKKRLMEKRVGLAHREKLPAEPRAALEVGQFR